MSERWKYQIRVGLFYGIVTTLLITIFDLFDKSFYESFFSMEFLRRIVIFILVGIFIVGYYNWKEKVKNCNL